MDMSILDKTLLEAKQDTSKQSAFYNAFLNSNVFIPTHDDSIGDSDPRRSKEGETFHPILIQNQNKLVLPIFDSEERLRDWAKRKINYVCMPAHALIKSNQGGVYFVLNAGTDYVKEFIPDELQWLKESAEASQPKEAHVPGGTQFLVGTPAKIPEGLEDALRCCFARNNEIHTAYLGQIFYQRPGEKPHLILVLKTSPLSKEALSAMQTDIGVAIRGKPIPDGMDVMFYTGSGVSAEVVKLVKPFYVNT